MTIRGRRAKKTRLKMPSEMKVIGSSCISPFGFCHIFHQQLFFCWFRDAGLELLFDLVGSLDLRGLFSVPNSRSLSWRNSCFLEEFDPDCMLFLRFPFNFGGPFLRLKITVHSHKVKYLVFWNAFKASFLYLKHRLKILLSISTMSLYLACSDVKVSLSTKHLCQWCTVQIKLIK